MRGVWLILILVAFILPVGWDYATLAPPRCATVESADQQPEGAACGVCRACCLSEDLPRRNRLATSTLTGPTLPWPAAVVLPPGSPSAAGKRHQSAPAPPSPGGFRPLRF